MCDNCTEFQQLLYSVERKYDAARAGLYSVYHYSETVSVSGNLFFSTHKNLVTKAQRHIKNYLFTFSFSASGTAERSDSELPLLTASDVNTSLQFLDNWHQKQCMCVFRDVKNLKRFSLVVECITKIALIKLKELPDILGSLSSIPEGDSQGDIPYPEEVRESRWTVEDLKKLLNYMAKVFMLQFPLYLAAKQASPMLDDLSQAEATNLAVFLDVRGDVADIPVVLLRNVARFCRSGGLNAMTAGFKLTATLLPSGLAHCLVSVLCNLKPWLNPRTASPLFWTVRGAALQYMCGLSDQDLRDQPNRAMAEFLWGSVKDNSESPLSLDKDGLELAFKYFSSTTLTMRLTGINQVSVSFVKLHHSKTFL